MKFSSLALATTLTLAFTGCALDNALNSVTSTIDSITAPSGTNHISNKYNLEIKNLTTVA